MRLFILYTLLAPPAAARADSALVERGNFPNRVHVFENFETRIDERWWHRGVEEKPVFEPGQLFPGPPNTRALRGGPSGDFDDKQGDRNAKYNAVVFNPVPGPPMGRNPRLSFAYKLKGTDKLRVQIFSLTNNYHRMVVLKGLPKDEWRWATVDMTKLRRPDGTGGPLSEDERIDDIQFYVDPAAEVVIDDIILYDAAPEWERQAFPADIVFAAWFDTGKQGPVGKGRSGEGNEWPGEFEIVPHEKPRTWKAAKSVLNERTKTPWLRIHMRGERPLPHPLQMRFRYKLTGADGKPVEVAVVRKQTGKGPRAILKDLKEGEWAETGFDLIERSDTPTTLADEIHILLPAGAQMLVDDLLLYQPAEAAY
jgi:hypothetical protein